VATVLILAVLVIALFGWRDVAITAGTLAATTLSRRWIPWSASIVGGPARALGETTTAISRTSFGSVAITLISGSADVIAISVTVSTATCTRLLIGVIWARVVAVRNRISISIRFLVATTVTTRAIVVGN
jgi:hypothetical protein